MQFALLQTYLGIDFRTVQLAVEEEISRLQKAPDEVARLCVRVRISCSENGV